MTNLQAIDHIRRAAHSGGGPTDDRLVTDYLAGRDEAAFAALVRRHGPMVLGVCRRVLGNDSDAHDAFQATFLVFVRKAGTLADRGRVAGWLYGVAYHTARKARAMNRIRRAKERAAGPRPDAGPADRWDDVRTVLDEELARLPETYRLAVVTCDLEGHSVREAARVLGWPQGTAATRLARGRALLARRLTGRGVTLAVPAVAAVLQTGAAAAVPPALTTSTIRAATGFAAGRAAADVVPTTAAALTEGVLRTMFLNQLKVYATTAVAVVTLVVGASLWPQPVQAQRPEFPKGPQVPGEKREKVAPADPKVQAAILKQLQTGQWTLSGVDSKKNLLSVGDGPLPSLSGGLSRDFDVIFAGNPGLMGLDDLPVAKDAKVTLDGTATELKRLRQGLQIKLTFADGKPEITAIEATTPHPGYVLKGVDAKARTITVSFGKDGALEALPVADRAYIYLYHTGNEGKLSDLGKDMRVSIQMGMIDGRLVVRDIRARK